MIHHLHNLQGFNSDVLLVQDLSSFQREKKTVFMATMAIKLLEPNSYLSWYSTCCTFLIERRNKKYKTFNNKFCPQLGIMLTILTSLFQVFSQRPMHIGHDLVIAKPPHSLQPEVNWLSYQHFPHLQTESKYLKAITLCKYLKKFGYQTKLVDANRIDFP